MALPKWPGIAIKAFGATLFVVLLAFTIWSVFFDKTANGPLTPDEQRRVDDMDKRTFGKGGSRAGVTVVNDGGRD